MKALITILFICCCTLSSCRYTEDDMHHYTVTFYNNSDQWVYLSATINYPDTTYVPNYNVLSSPNIFKVAPRSYNKTALEIRDTYEQRLRIHTNGDRAPLMLFVFDANILEATKKYNYDAVLQRIDVTLDDLRKSNWLITYPSDN